MDQEPGPSLLDEAPGRVQVREVELDQVFAAPIGLHGHWGRGI